MNEIKVIAFLVGKEPELIDMENSLDAQQAFVDGHIECVSLGDNFMLVCNEEGKLRRLPVNRYLYDGISPGAPLDALVGDFFVCRTDGEEFTSAQEDDIGRIYGSYIA